MHGIYIHIPFCEQKCRYCDFLSFPGEHMKEKERYVDALCEEMRLRIQGKWRTPQTIFIGGGTPTALTAACLERLLAVLSASVDIENVEEFTVEANPGTIDAEKLSVLRAAGVDRLSFGVQSFDDTLLRRIGRIHTAQDAVEAVALARQAGFDNINLDLMYGLPGQTAEQWRATVVQALALAPSHLSLYQLIVEEGTAIARQLAEGVMPPVDEDGAAEWFVRQRDWLAASGYAQYEVSNYAQSGYASKHNQLYWRLDDYLGLGLGATSWIRPVRWVNTTDLQAYCAALESGVLPPSEAETLTRDEQMSESVFMALRMNEGLSRARFRSLYGVDVVEAFSDAVREGLSQGWLTVDEERLRLTDAGCLVGNWVFELFI